MKNVVIAANESIFYEGRMSWEDSKQITVAEDRRRAAELGGYEQIIMTFYTSKPQATAHAKFARAYRVHRKRKEKVRSNCLSCLRFILLL